ncbi:MAG: hypoxanthine phosphoribosyltransferase [Proteobacteria bacterium]|nr:hypoxanthine phosphoribosyltransferase [Pseudomonadota bacterium]MBU4471314.1 hypoxanthine phosphoribosyltransferase [Pseudomonadota bacterium]MCG2751681.1 hypoxanthine phosphoribosyltransferase [Desulfobacteraceae bacterium]
MTELLRVLSKEQIQESVARLAEKISLDYTNKDLVLIGVLKGSFIFLADLSRALCIPVEIDFIGASSYGSNTYSSGAVRITKEIRADLKGRHVLLVEDIIDSGQTLAYLVEHIRSLGPETVRTCAMIDKMERRVGEVVADYACHTIETGFLVGYGLDFNEKYRNLPEIYHLVIQTEPTN